MLPLLALLLTAAPAAKAPPDLDAARALLAEAARETDPARSRELAARAVPGFLAARAPDTVDCWLLAVTAEAQLRAADARSALATIADGSAHGCDPAAFANLSAWAAEYAPDGRRRGPGAPLELARSEYFRAAALWHERPDSADAEAGALASGGEVALTMGDAEAAREAGLRGLRLSPGRDLAVRCGVLVLAAASADLGEGGASDLVAEAVGDSRDILRDILDARVTQVGAALEERPGDPYLLAAAGFYSLFTGGDVALGLARHHLDKAAQSGFPLPELSYLRGRVALGLGDAERAIALWRQQQRDFPGVAASRLAANDLAYELATRGAPARELEAALGALDPWLARSPREPALHETRALLLERLGRPADAAASMDRAHALEATPERAEALARMRAAR